MTQAIRIFTKSTLKKANAIAIKRGYNRSLNEDFIMELPDDLFFLVTNYFVHQHKHGVHCDAHIRVTLCLGEEDGQGIIETLDCDWNLFYKLPAFPMSLAAGDSEGFSEGRETCFL